MASRPLIRSFVVLLLALASLIPAAGAAAQATSLPEQNNPFTDLGLPQIDITVTDSAFEGIPGQLDAGRYVVTLLNQTSETEGTMGGAFMAIPSDMTLDDFLALAAPMEGDAGSENAEAAASPTGDDDSGVPAWYYEVKIAGGPYAFRGQTAYTVVDLAPGDWVFWAEYPGAAQAPVPITVSGEMPADLPLPSADVRIEMDEFNFSFSAPLASGPQILEIANVGEQPHFIGMGLLPPGTTEQELLGAVEGILGGPEDAAPAASPEGGLSFEDIPEVFGTGDQSAGVTTWYAISLEPGTYGAICFVTDPESGLPHVMIGMLAVIEVS